jgi:F0F1-type ATP synthase epsilon subunit
VGRITLSVVTRRGTLIEASDLDEVVVRRREQGFPLGSEVAILPAHGPELLLTCAHELRYRKGDRMQRLVVGAGVAEVLDDRVTVLVTDAPSSEARAVE